MRPLLWGILRSQLIVHGMALLLLLAVFIVEKALKINVGPLVYLIYVYAACFCLVGKPSLRPNWSWLRTLPLTRLRLLGVVCLEPMLALAFFAFNSAILGLIYNPELLTQGQLMPALAKTVHLFRAVSFSSWIPLGLVAFSFTPLLILVPLSRSIPALASTKQRKFFLLMAAVVCGGLFFTAPILVGAIFVGLGAGSIAYVTTATIFVSRTSKKWKRAYSLGVALCLPLVIIMDVEIFTSEKARPIYRVKSYGVWAPRIPRETLIAILAEPDLADNLRLDIANFESSRTPPNQLASAKEVETWSKAATSNRVFFLGLTYLQSEVWTSPALTALEKTLISRCMGGPIKSKWTATWKCDPKDRILTANDHPLHLDFKVEQSPELLGLLSTEHPVLASLLLESSMLRGQSADWKPKVEMLIKSDSPLLVDHARRWLDRANANPKGEWDCTERHHLKGSVCTEAGSSQNFGLRLESQMADDPGGQIQFVLKE